MDESVSRFWTLDHLPCFEPFVMRIEVSKTTRLGGPILAVTDGPATSSQDTRDGEARWGKWWCEWTVRWVCTGGLQLGGASAGSTATFGRFGSKLGRVTGQPACCRL